MSKGNGGDDPHILPIAEEVKASAVEMIIKAEGGRVIVRYPTPQLWVAFDPANAVEVGKHLIDCAVACGAKVTIEVPRRQVSREKREALIARVMHVTRSLQEKRRPHAIVAQHVVDSILAAID